MQINQRVHEVGRGRVQRVAHAIAAVIALLGFTMTADGAATSAPPSTPTPAPAPAKVDTGATLKHNIESRFPGAHVLDVQPSPIPGLYEVFMGDQIVYTDGSGDHLIVGSLIDTQTKENLTQARLNDRGRIDFGSLPLQQAIKVVKGNGRRVFAVFSDPDCPYCQQLEKTLLTVNDTTMYVFLFPISSLHPQAATKAHSIWCASDRAAAWNHWMHDKALPPTKNCAGDPIDALQKLGDELHINSTPTLFFANGTRIAGAIPADDLERALNGSKPAPQKAVK